MTSSPDDPGAAPGLLTPVAAGTPVDRLTTDAAVADAMLTTEQALATALATTGLAPSAHAETVARCCARMREDLRTDPALLADVAARAGSGGNPVIPLVADLRERVAAVDGDAAGVVHRGATSQDVLDTALMLVARAALDRVAADLREAAAHAADLADRHRATLACGRTLGQQAMPTTFGFRAAGWLAGLTDAVVRVRAVASTLPVQLGGPVGTTAGYGGGRGVEAVDALAAGLGLRAPVLCWHTRRTPLADVAHAVAVATGAVGKVAADVVLMAQAEVGEAAEADGGPSSSMAHKANPAQSVLVSSAARQVPALASVLHGSMAAEQERPAGAWHAEWEPLRLALRLCGGAVHRCAGVLAGLRVDPERMRANLDDLVGAAGLDESEVAETPVATGPWVDRAIAGYRTLDAHGEASG